jgi:hypothetical protein
MRTRCNIPDKPLFEIVIEWRPLSHPPASRADRPGPILSRHLNQEAFSSPAPALGPTFAGGEEMQRPTTALAMTSPFEQPRVLPRGFLPAGSSAFQLPDRRNKHRLLGNSSPPPIQVYAPACNGECMIEDIELLIRTEIERQATDDDVLLYDNLSGMVDGVLDVRSVATAVEGAISSQRFVIAENGDQTA